MKKILFAVPIAVLLLIFSFAFKSSQSLLTEGFVINGTVEGFPDNTMLYLIDRSGVDNVPIDSTAINGGHFTFKGSIKSKTVYATIQTKNLSDYKFIWLENKAMTFKAVKGKFRGAVITGSDTQADADRLAALTAPDNEKTDQLNKQYRNASADQKSVIEKQIDSARHHEHAVCMEFIKKNPSSIVSVNVLNIYSSTFGPVKTGELYANLTSEMKNSPDGKSVLNYIKLNKDLKVGDHYADFSALDSEGKTVKLSDYAGKVFLIDFWASWCGPCRANNPALVKTYSEFRSKGFEIVGVSIDRMSDKKAWLDAIKTDGLTWPNISQLTGDKCDAALIYGIAGIPDNFLVDKNGVILARNLRGEELDNTLKELFK